MKTVDGLTDVRSNLSEGRPSAAIVVDQAKAAAAGVSPATLSQYLTLILNGYPLGIVPTTPAHSWRSSWCATSRSRRSPGP